MDLSWLDPITIDCGGVQYSIASWARPARAFGSDYDTLSPSEAAWTLNGLVGRADVIASLRRALLPGQRGVDRYALGEALVHAAERGTIVVRRREVRPVVGFGSVAGPAPAPPALGPEDAPEKTWFEVKIVDVYGKPVDGADVTFTQSGGNKEKLKTNGNGVARWKDVDGPSFATVKLSSPKDLRDALKDRWGSADPAEGLDGTKLSIAEDELSAAVDGETPLTLVLYKPLTRVRVIGMHFDTNKCFLRETAMRGIRQVVGIYQANPKGKLLIVGHTDTVGDPNANLDLSVERAEAVKAYLKDDVAAWEAWFGSDKPATKRWGKREVSEMIAALPCDQSVEGFQQWSNETRGTSLKVDGIAGEKTRKELITAYMALDGTTLPDSIEAVVHGLGEFFPEKDLGDDVDEPANRRVEMYCFDDEIQPPSPGKKGSKGEAQYKRWQKQVTENVDVSGDGNPPVLTIRLLDAAGDPIANAPYSLSLEGEERKGNADQSGMIHEKNVPTLERCKLKWGYPPAGESLDEPSLDFEVELFLDYDEQSRDEGARQRLFNLGYQEDDFGENVKSFQEDFDLEQKPWFDQNTFDALKKIHDEP